MKKILVVIDMQNDFIDGALGTSEAVNIVDNVVKKIREEEWECVYMTLDTHDGNYLETQEGKNLPVKHCIMWSDGWRTNKKIYNEMEKLDNTKTNTFVKNTFGSTFLAELILPRNVNPANYEVILVGVCTDICVISNALLLKAYYPEMKIIVDAACCAGSTPEKHRMALEVMKSCHIDVINE